LSATGGGAEGFTLLGQGECRQGDGEYPLKYSAGLPEFYPHTSGDNAAKAKVECERMCAKYAWCFAAEVVLLDYNPYPECRLVTDRPTFERYYGSDQDYSWAAKKYIDGEEYYTYCNGGNPACAAGNTYSSNWDGGKLNPRKGYWCYMNNNPATPSPTPDAAPSPKPTPTPKPSPKPEPTPIAGFRLLGQGECRQANGEMALLYTTSYYDLSKDDKAGVTARCEDTCSQYGWCYAAEVALFGDRAPECSLVTDRPTFERFNGGGQDYEWGDLKTIDGVEYQVYCGGTGTDGRFHHCAADNTYSSNWDGGRLLPRSGYWCYINDGSGPAPTPRPTPAADDFTLLGQGGCRQADGDFPLYFSTGYPDISADNMDKVTARCEDTCARYKWCYAAEVAYEDYWYEPECHLVTDRPTFEQYNGNNQDYSWGAITVIDGYNYQTYCGGTGADGKFHQCAADNTYSSNWDGGKLAPYSGYWCYINNRAASFKEQESFKKLGEGECRQKNGEYALIYSTRYYDLSKDDEAHVTARCEDTCARYGWCYAAEVAFVEYWSAPECHLITDRPTFERFNGGGQDYSWGAIKTIDGVDYQTLCGGTGADNQFHVCAADNKYSSNWDGGKLVYRKDFWCYINNTTNSAFLLGSTKRPGSTKRKSSERRAKKKADRKAARREAKKAKSPKKKTRAASFQPAFLRPASDECKRVDERCGGYNQGEADSWCCSGYCHVMDVEDDGLFVGLCEESCQPLGDVCAGASQYQADAKCCSGSCDVTSVDSRGKHFGMCTK